MSGMKIRTEGAYIIKAAESRPVRVLPNHGLRPPAIVTDEDRRIVRELLKAKARG